MAIYHNGYNLEAIVSTGSKLWNVTVPGQLRNDTWNNIAIRWKQPIEPAKYDKNLPSVELGGLEVI